MAPVRNVTAAAQPPPKETELQKSRQQVQMQQQQNKRQHRSTSRYRINTAPSGGGSGATRSSSAFCGRRAINGHHEYTAVTTNHSQQQQQQQPKCGGAIVKTFKTSTTGEAGGLINTKYSGNRHLHKNKHNNNNNNNTSTAVTEAVAPATELQRKRQQSPEKRFTTINGRADEAHFDISDIAILNNSHSTYAERLNEEHDDGDDIITNIAELRKLLNETQTTSIPISNALVKLQTKSNNNPLLPLNLLSLAASLPTVQTTVRPTITTAYARTPPNPFGGGYINVESLLLQRLELIKHCLRLTAASVGGFQQQHTHHTDQSEVVTSTTATHLNNLATQRGCIKSLMVHENKPESMERDVVVNSTSLEDVANSELGDRAQSIQSLHSVETPTPDDSTPSFDELQQRLETSNRNIQNMQEQQQQLLRLQNAAKQHLSEMEHLRQQAGTLSFGGGGPNQSGGVGGGGGTNTNDGAPEYESIDQVHSDMATLVGRMKNLTTFIQNQNELSSLLGDDGPEILAEQEALQRKLESLRAQRDDMRTLVNELQSINRTAERRVADGDGSNATNDSEVVAQKPATADIVTRDNLPSQNTNSERVVPVTYTRNVPIKLANGGVAQPLQNTSNKENGDGADNYDDDDAEEKAATALLIQQKVADIETMRKQLRRLKEMMDTVNMIEARTSNDVTDIGRDLRSQSRSTNSSGASFDRECTPVSVVHAHHLRAPPSSVGNGGADGGDDDAYLTRKMRMINEVTSDLRAQAESLQAERDRIKALKEEIIMRKQQAADAAQLGDDALKRASLTPTPTPRSRKQRELDTPSPPPAQTTTQQNDPLKQEYEEKKREFEILCQRLQQQQGDTATQSEAPNTTTAAGNNNKAPRRRDIVSEADDEADGDEELIDSDFPTSNATSTARQYFTAPQQQSTPAQQHRAAAKAAVTAHTLANGTTTTKVNANQSHHQSLQNQRLSKEDSFETNATTSSAGERRHSTLANATNTTHDGASIEAGSMQSGSSAFSMPPPMPAMGACSSWPPMPPLPNTWNPQFYYGFGASAAPPHPPNASQPNSATTTQSAGASYTPVGLLPPSAVNSDCICSGGNSATNAPIVTGGPTPVSNSSNTAAQLAADPVLLHQFVQTQQMLINSVCQCNQMLWHQQREIDALNQTIHMLQERLHAITSSGINSVPLNDLPFSIRAESVPPPTLTAGSLHNNLFLSSANRAQSEQPTAIFLPGMTTATTAAARNSAFTNYQHLQQQQQQQQQYQQRQTRGHISTVNGGGAAATNSYNFSSETQHSNIATASSTNAGLYSTLNNAAVQQPPPPPNQVPTASHYNNEIPQSPPLHGPGNGAGPGPIFMHHHNNAIHQNNANLRTQNHYANNLLHQQQQLPPQQQQQHGHSNINIVGGGGGANTLNNQVPPGNRANNYWDNFRSYSRQNLLSTNSNKSNEEQQQQNQQMQQQQQAQQQQSQHQHYLQQRVLEPPPGGAHYRAPTQPHPRATTALPTAAALTTSNLQQLQRQQQEEVVQQQQQQRPTQTQPQLQQMYSSSIGESNNSNSCNNLNFERNASNNKYLRTLQRSHINRYQQQQQQQQNPSFSNTTFGGNHNNLYQSWLPNAGGTTDANATDNAGAVTNNGDVDDNAELEVYETYNIIDSDLATSPYAHLSNNICTTNSSNMLRNMNVNYGNSPHYQRNKLLAKPNCRGNDADAAMEQQQHNLNRARQQQQQQQRLLTQQHLALRAQQQLDQSTLRPIPNMSGFKPACYLDLLPATVSEAVATAEARLRNRERVDMLLRTVTAAAQDEVDVSGAQEPLTATADGSGVTSYHSAYMPPSADSVLLLDSSNEIGNTTPNLGSENVALNGDDVNVMHHDDDDDAEEEEDDEDEDDTTSEEIKRNLLVNALKNDKFTTKFYESIKEDVFRRLERVLLERESAEGNCQGGGGGGAAAANAPQLCNGLSNATNSATRVNAIDVCSKDVLSAGPATAAVARDPTRKFNLNARMGNQQLQQRLQQYQQQQQERQQQQQQYQQHTHTSTSPSSHHLAAAAQAALANCYQIQQELANEQAAEDDQHVVLPPLAVHAHNRTQPVAVDENAEEDEFSANNADTESNKADNEDAAAAAAAIHFSHVERMPDLVQTRESEQPEEDNATNYTNSNNDSNNNDNNNVAAGDETIVSVSNAGRAEGNIGNWRKNMLNHVDCNAERMTSAATNNAVKRKNQSEIKNNSGAGGDAEAMPIANNTVGNNMRSTYYTDLIAYIITRIRNQTHTNTQINDTLLVEISKLTASAVQNFAPTLVNYKSLSATSPHISPKKFYMKIKKLSVPRQRDDFLQWYQNYLEHLFPGARLEAERRREEMRNNGGGMVAAAGAASTAVLVLPRMSDKVENQKQVQQQNLRQLLKQQQSSSVNSNKDNNDEDLAEADQNSANSSSNTIDMTDGACAQPQPKHECNKNAAVALMRENELENNENPDDDDDTDTNERACAASNANGKFMESESGLGAVAAGTSSTYASSLHAATSAARTAAAAITDDAILAAVQQSDLLRYGTDAAGATGSNILTSSSSSSNSHA